MAKDNSLRIPEKNIHGVGDFKDNKADSSVGNHVREPANNSRNFISGDNTERAPSPFGPSAAVDSMPGKSRNIMSEPQDFGTAILDAPLDTSSGKSSRGSPARTNETFTDNISHHQSRRSASNGILSSILNAAHNAMSFNLEEDQTSGKKEHTFSLKLDSLLKPKSEKTIPAPPNASEDDSKAEDNELKSSASNVQFESVRESPINTLGYGDLSLDHFDQERNLKKNGSIRHSRKNLSSPNRSTENLHDQKRSVSPDIVNRQMPPNNQLAVSGNGDSKRIHRLSVTGALDRIKSQNTDKIADSESDPSMVLSDVDDQVEDFDYSNIQFASDKRNKEFHQIFKQLPSNEKLIEDYSCAISKDILVQGRMYLSEHFICFNSNILGWVTNLMIPLQEVIQIEKKFTAVLFPNGIVIRTLHHKYVFATLLSRDTSFGMITNVWHNVLGENTDSEINKVISSKKRKRGESRSTVSKSISNDLDSETESQESDDTDTVSSLSLDMDDTNNADDVDVDEDTADIDDEDDDDDENNDDEAFAANDSSNIRDKDKGESGAKENGKGTFNGLPLLGPQFHAPTTIDYQKQSNETVVSDEILKAPVGAIFSILFGADKSKYIKILKNQKNYDISESNISELSMKKKERNYTYIKPLYGPIGPKLTKCLITDKLLHFDLDDYILVEQSTSTPDVPSGNVFKVRTKIYLTWAENNSSRMYVLTTVEWSGKSWIKGAIEKGSIEGQKDSMKIMIDSLNDLINSTGNGTSKSIKKKSKRKKSFKADSAPQLKAPENPQDLPITTQLSNLMEKIGELISIPYVSNRMTGIFILMLAFIVILKMNTFLFGSGNSNVSILPESHTISNIEINNHKYMVVSSVDANFANVDARLESEANIWDWVRNTSDGKLQISSESSSHLKRYSNQEIEEIVRLTQMKLDELSNNYNLQF
ncbi:uncharacterized protein PRCAT00001528001 [Priceomyces carsonii]|uniref:uncharacterized protein n=1 Tax=Priceomyces carsonii TaxID=28549 RepID=UPI002ED8691B|nr:unnamed protein product [Priceomyces carsonii]